MDNPCGEWLDTTLDKMWVVSFLLRPDIPLFIEEPEGVYRRVLTLGRGKVQVG